MTERRLLLTGCGRSGTNYTANLLTSLGVLCGHERVFSLRNVLCGEAVWPADVPAESSWLGAPYLAHLPAGVVVLHQVRAPLDVLRSLERVGLFSGEDAYREFAERHMTRRGPCAGAGSLELGLRYWDEWNALVEEGARAAGRDYRRFRLDEVRPEFLRALLAELGYERSSERVEAAFAAVSPDANTRGDKSGDAALTWAALPEGELKRAVEARAAAYGFPAPA